MKKSKKVAYGLLVVGGVIAPTIGVASSHAESPFLPTSLDAQPVAASLPRVQVLRTGAPVSNFNATAVASADARKPNGG